MTLYELLKKDVKRMMIGIGKNGKGNIHPLIVGEIEKYIIEIALEENGYNLLMTSKMLGIGRSTLYRKIKALNIIIDIPHHSPE